SDNAGLALLRAQPRHRVVAAPKLEGTDALQVLALEEDLCAQPGVKRTGHQHGRTMRSRADACCSLDDIVVSRDGNTHIALTLNRREDKRRHKRHGWNYAAWMRGWDELRGVK